MADKKKKDGEEEEGKKGKNKKVIIIVMLVIGLFGFKTFFMKPKELTPAQIAAEKVALEHQRAVFCSVQNDYELPKEKEDDEHATAADAEPEPEVEGGPVLELEAITINLADRGGNHYLKLGLGLQLPEGTLMEEIKEEGIGAPALDKAIEMLGAKTKAELESRKARSDLRSKLGFELCTGHESIINRVYFTDFVMQ